MLTPGMLLSSRYKIESVLGQGGMGAVYLATMEALGNKRVAVKEMELKGFSSDELAAAVVQFKREASFLANLEHPNLVQVTDFFIEGDKHYLVMAYVTGETLQQKLKREGRPFAWNRVKAFAEPLVDVLHYLHTQTPPILFRDLKPSNIMIEESGRLRLIDFGIARAAHAGERTSTFLQGTGTSGFSPIEQYGGAQSTDQRSDIYALGATLYYMLTGKIPPDAVARISQGVKLIPPTELQPSLPKQVDSLLSKALEVRQNDRHATMAEFKKELMAIDQPDSEGITENFLEAPPMPPPSANAEENRPAAIMVEMFPTTAGQKPQQNFLPWLIGAASVAVASMALIFAVHNFMPSKTTADDEHHKAATASTLPVVTAEDQSIEHSSPSSSSSSSETKTPPKPQTVTKTTHRSAIPEPDYYTRRKPVQTRVVHQEPTQSQPRVASKTTTTTTSSKSPSIGTASYPRAEKYPKARTTQSTQPTQQPQQPVIIVREQPQQQQPQQQYQQQPPPPRTANNRPGPPPPPRDANGNILYDPNNPPRDQNGNPLPPPPGWHGSQGSGGPRGGPMGQGEQADGPPGYNTTRRR